MMVVNFYEYLAQKNRISLEEAARRSLARTWQLTRSGKVISLITAFRGENTYQVNLARNQQLAQDLRQFLFGFIPVVGTTLELVRDPKTGQETGEKRRVEEQSFLVSFPDTMPDNRLQDLMLSLVQKYGQEACIIKYGDFPDAFLLRNDGTQISLGAWTKDRLAQFYTRMKYGADAPNRSFTFEYADDTTLSTKMAMRYFSD
jgi:hypothetical protein